MKAKSKGGVFNFKRFKKKSFITMCSFANNAIHDLSEIKLKRFSAGYIFSELSNYIDENFIGCGQVKVILKLDKYRLLSYVRNTSISIWNIFNGECIQQLNDHDKLVNYLVNINANILASASVMSACCIKIFNINEQKYTHTLVGHTSMILGIVNISETLFCSYDNSGEVLLWSKESYEKLMTISSCGDMPVSTLIKLSSDQLALGINNLHIHFITFDVENELFVEEKKLPLYDQLTCLAKLSNNKIAVGGSGEFNKLIKIIKYDDNSLESTLEHHESIINTILYLKNEDLLLSGGHDFLICLWDLKPYTLITSYSCHTFVVNRLIKFNKELIVSCSDDCTVKLWKISNQNPPIELHSTLVYSVKFNSHFLKIPNSNLLACTLKDEVNSLTIWDTKLLKSVTYLQEGKIKLVVNLRKGRIATLNFNNRVRIWDFNSPDSRGVFINPIDKDNSYQTINMLPLDLNHIVIICETYLRIYNITSLVFSEKHLSFSHSLRAAYNSSMIKINSLTFVCPNNTDYIVINLIKTDDKEWVFSLKTRTLSSNHSDTITCLSKVENDLILSGSYDRTVCLFDITKNQCVSKVDFEGSIVYSIKRLRSNVFVFGDEDGEASVRDLSTDFSLLKKFKHGLLEIHHIERFNKNQFGIVGVDNVIKIYNIDI